MTAIARNLDHAGTAVADLDAGGRAYANLGFHMTPRSQHRGALTPGAPVQLFGQGNHCAMLEQGYLEVMGIFDRSLPTPAQQYLDKYEGLHVVAFRPASIEAIRALATTDGPLEPPRELGREVDYGKDAKEKRRVDFLNSKFKPAQFPEATFFYTEHLSRDVMWQPHLLEHPNGAKALACAFLCSTEPERTAQRLAKVLAVTPSSSTAGEYALGFENSSLVVLSPQAWERRYPGATGPAFSRPVGYAIRVASLQKTIEVLDANDVPHDRSDRGGVFVGPAFACGNVIHFTESDPS